MFGLDDLQRFKIDYADGGYRYEQTQTAARAETEDAKEALTAFREKRKPGFKRR